MLDRFFLVIIYFLAKVTSFAYVSIQHSTDEINYMIFIWKAGLLKAFCKAEWVGIVC